MTSVSVRPRLLLLDEPFASLDPPLRAELRALVLELHRRRDTSTLYVTHDLEDAFHLGDRIAVPNRGKVEQIGSPEEIYRRPKTPFVARLVGKGALVPGRLRGKELETAFGKISNSCPELPEGSEVLVLLRPEDLEVSKMASRGSSAKFTSKVALTPRVSRSRTAISGFARTGGLCRERAFASV